MSKPIYITKPGASERDARVVALLNMVTESVSEAKAAYLYRAWLCGGVSESQLLSWFDDVTLSWPDDPDTLCDH